MDAGLAKVLNSTVGTSDLKSLDKIFEDSMRLIGSEDVMYVYTGTFTETAQEEYVLNTLIANQYITFDTPGTVRIKTEQMLYPNTDANASAGCSTQISLSVLNESGNVITSISTPTGGTTAVLTELYVDINVVPGEKYKIKIGGRAFWNDGAWKKYMRKTFSVCGKTIFFGAKVTATN